MAVDPAKMRKLTEEFLNGKMSSGDVAASLRIEEMDALLEQLDRREAEKIAGANVAKFKKIA